MCDYLSAIGLLDGDVYHQDGVDRHSELIRMLAPKLNVGEQQLAESCFELEFNPPEGIHLGSIGHYRLNLDGCRLVSSSSPLVRNPRMLALYEAFNSQKETWQTKMCEIARSKILSSGHIEVLPPGDWVLCGDVRVDEVTERSRVIAILDDAQILHLARNADVTAYDNSYPQIPRDYQWPAYMQKTHRIAIDRAKAKDVTVIPEYSADDFKPVFGKIVRNKSNLVIFDDVAT